MKAFKNHQSIIEDYKKFLKSFFTISDRRIKEEVEKKFEENSSCDSYIPEPLIQFNPSYKTGLSLDDIPGAHSELKISWESLAFIIIKWKPLRKE